MKAPAVRAATRVPAGPAAAPSLAALAVLAFALPASLLFGAAGARAATAYVSDELVLGVYAQQNNQGQRLTTLHSGARVETLGVEGEFTQVQLADGTTGWVKSAFLVAHEPAAARVKELEDELNRARATTPALADTAVHGEVDRLRAALADKQTELQTALATRAAADAALPRGGVASSEWTRDGRRLIWWAVAAPIAALLLGFWLGYAALARRLRRKFGGIKVY